MKGKAKVGANFGAEIKKHEGMVQGARVAGRWHVRCKDPEGKIKWEEEYSNIVVNEGLDDLLDTALNGATQNSTWFIGLINSTSPSFAGADVMTSHAGWTESTNYSAGTRPKWQSGTVSGQSIDNSTTVASVTVASTGKFGGAFLVSISNKGSSTGGLLYAEGAFASVRQGSSGDTLEITATFTTADDGV